MAEMANPNESFDTVGNEEIVFRRVENDPFFFRHNESTGELEITHQAFRDKYKKPSVDRSQLCNHDPKWTQWDHGDAGVVSLVTGEVRAIEPPIISRDNRGRQVDRHDIDVVPDPITEIQAPGERINPAHAQIISSPPAPGGAFDRLLVALANLAQRRGWLIKPVDYRD